jgi:hypothetical protein
MRFTALATTPARNRLQHIAFGTHRSPPNRGCCTRLVHGRVGAHSKILKLKSWLPGMGSNHNYESSCKISKLLILRAPQSHESARKRAPCTRPCTRKLGARGREGRTSSVLRPRRVGSVARPERGVLPAASPIRVRAEVPPTVRVGKRWQQLWPTM